MHDGVTTTTTRYAPLTGTDSPAIWLFRPGGNGP
jgi:hypothetical protein